MESFENIYLDLSKQPGKCRVAETGLGWRQQGGEPFTLEGTNIISAQWSRAARGYEVKIMSRTSGVIQLDGFDQEDFDRVGKAFKLFYGINLESKEHALRGWNWGKSDFGKYELAFNVQNRPAFAIPYTEISNTNLAGKNEVSVELALPVANGEDATVNGSKTNPRAKRRKNAGPRDELVEMRFYIPGTTSRKEAEEDGEEVKSVDGEDVEEMNAANLFYNTLIDKAEIGEVAGDTFATFLDVLHLTPRGRFDIDMYENSFRLRGKTYDYKIVYKNIKKFMVLPKPDELHMLIVIGLDPPLRQGQTKYPFLVMQFKKEEEVELDLNMTEEMIKEKYQEKLQSHYEDKQFHIVAKVFKGLSGQKVITPSKEFMSHHEQTGVKCSIKANEGLLYCLDRSFMFVPKPAQYIAFADISVIVMSRVGGAISASRTFDVTVTLKDGRGEHQFSNINREEQAPLEAFFKLKNLKTRNEMLEDSSALLANALDAGMISSDDEVAPANPDRGSADEDDESVDEDFKTDSESDVAEEYDSAHESSGASDEEGGGDGDVEMEDGDGDEDVVEVKKTKEKVKEKPREEKKKAKVNGKEKDKEKEKGESNGVPERPKKKVKTGK
ncbi:MAG: FACT complex subunit [Icmadophila ericetorum]|nr:FACT complex subunit [Icmadophila ericetorum]